MIIAKSEMTDCQMRQETGEGEFRDLPAEPLGPQSQETIPTPDYTRKEGFLRSAGVVGNAKTQEILGFLEAGYFRKPMPYTGQVSCCRRRDDAQ